MDKRIVINMLSNADKVEGQGVGSAYLEQVKLVSEGASDLFDVRINSVKKADIVHSHTIEPQNYLRMKNNKNANVCYVHFLPDTLDAVSYTHLDVYKRQFYIQRIPISVRIYYVIS